jgi:hypothetical protein
MGYLLGDNKVFQMQAGGEREGLIHMTVLVQLVKMLFPRLFRVSFGAYLALMRSSLP